MPAAAESVKFVSECVMTGPRNGGSLPMRLTSEKGDWIADVDRTDRDGKT